MLRDVLAYWLRLGDAMIPKSRLDALTDGVFAFAMTLLVVDLKLPERFSPADADTFVNALYELKGQFVAYVISFVVLSVRWISIARLRADENVAKAHVGWALVHLFLVTCVPFSTMVVGRYGQFAPAIWLYAANTLLSAFAALRMVSLVKDRDDDIGEWRAGLLLIIALSLLSVAISFVNPRWALWAYLLNVFAPLVRRHQRKTS